MTEKKIVIGLFDLISVSFLCTLLISDELFLVRDRRDGKQYGMSSWYGAGDYSAGASNRLQFQFYFLKLFILMASSLFFVKMSSMYWVWNFCRFGQFWLLYLTLFNHDCLLSSLE